MECPILAQQSVSIKEKKKNLNHKVSSLELIYFGFPYLWKFPKEKKSSEKHFSKSDTSETFNHVFK